MIVNPGAGSVADMDVLLKQLQRLRPEKVQMTRRVGDAEAMTQKAIRAGQEYIIAAGGDGTLNEVVNGIAQSGHGGKVRAGIVPLGTGNDFARSLDLPQDIDDNIDILRTGKTRPIDLVRATGRRTRYFVNVSTGGFSGIIDEKLTPEIKRSWGPLAYVRGAAAALPRLKAYRTAIVFDDNEQLSVDLYNVVVANGQFVGGGLPIAPQADLGDGLLDVILIPNLPVAEIALLGAKIILGKHLDMVIARRARKVAVKSRPGMWFNLDGELVGNEPIVFQVDPRALNFVTGKDEH